jgi:branched-chain amino acid transport system ATP-binding protein
MDTEHSYATEGLKGPVEILVDSWGVPHVYASSVPGGGLDWSSAEKGVLLQLFPRLQERLAQADGTPSGGEHLLLALGKALMLESKLIPLDEPSQGLAPKLVAEMYEKLGEIRTLGTTILLVEQKNVTAALRYASRTYLMEQGRIALEGTSEELRSNDEVRRAYLGI